MRMRALALLAFFIDPVFATTGPENSALWGRDGEANSPTGRLPDVSYAGYACGDKPLPIIAAVANVRDFGAKGDGTTDDSEAFLTAIDKTAQGAILVPPGRYRITQILEIHKPGIVLRGAGSQASVLVCPVPLNDIKPNWGATTSGQRTSNYSWSGGIVSFKGSNPAKRIGKVTAAAMRGSHELRVDGATADVKPGAWVEITVRDDAQKSLLDHLYSGDPGPLGKIKPASHQTSFVSRVQAVADGRLTLERPLRIDVRPEWNAEIRFYEPTVTECGIEDLGFEFPVRTYGGHFSELGFNGVVFSGVAHCWAKNLCFTNADSGVFAAGRFCTIDGLRCQLAGVQETKGLFGHHGVTLSGHDNLFTHFEIRQRFVHDITVEGGAGNVASSGSGTDLCFDHHKRAPYDNVFTDIDLGAGTRMWHCGGGADLGRNCGARGTFWNIRAKRPQPLPSAFGPPSINLVAVPSNEPSITEINGRWLEVLPPGTIQPANLHQAQWMKRMAAR